MWGEDLLVVFVIKVFIPSVDCLHEQLEYRATDKNHLSASKRRCLSALSKGFGKPRVTGWSDHLSRGKCEEGCGEFLLWTWELSQEEPAVLTVPPSLYLI